MIELVIGGVVRGYQSPEKREDILRKSIIPVNFVYFSYCCMQKEEIPPPQTLHFVTQKGILEEWTNFSIPIVKFSIIFT